MSTPILKAYFTVVRRADFSARQKFLTLATEFYFVVEYGF